MIIAIDGPAASGKGTLGKRLAAHYGLRHLDTGLIYRGVAKAVLDAGHAPDDRARAIAAAEGLDLTRYDEPSLKTQAVDEAAAVVSAIREVRAAVLAFQHNFGRTRPGAVLDGRDIGTVIFPDAEVKLFVTATPQVRAGRRVAELQARGVKGHLAAQTRAGRALARHHTFGYRRRIPGRHRHRRSRPSRPEARLTVFPSWRMSLLRPASLVAHGTQIIVLIAGSSARAAARGKRACGGCRR